MHWTRTTFLVALAAIAVLVGGTAVGRHLIASGGAGRATSAPVAAKSSPSPARAVVHGATGAHKAPLVARAPVNGTASASAKAGSVAGSPVAASGSTGGDTQTGSSAASSPSASDDGGLLDVPVFPVTPQVVHTATLAVRVGKGKLVPALQDVTALAGADGGYVESSSLSGGTARRSPVAGTIVFRVLDSDFATAMAAVAHLGTVNDQHINGQDVTLQVARNAASIAVLQDEVNLLEQKLSQTSDIGTFLQIEGQLFPVEQQLQQLQSSQAVLENSAALATLTVSLSAPGAPLAPVPVATPRTDAATASWRYLRHNSLAVLDGLAVAFGWALPVLVLAALVGTAGWRIARRRRHAVTPA
jgi:hypothetical protein